MYNLDIFLKTGNQLQIDKPWSEPLRHGIGDVRKVFYKKIGNCILPINHIEDFEGSPYIFEFTKRIMASAVGFVIIHQECTESDIRSYIRFNDQCIPVFHAAGNTIWKITAIDDIEIDFK